MADLSKLINFDLGFITRKDFLGGGIQFWQILQTWKNFWNLSIVGKSFQAIWQRKNPTHVYFVLRQQGIPFACEMESDGLRTDDPLEKEYYEDPAVINIGFKRLPHMQDPKIQQIALQGIYEMRANQEKYSTAMILNQMGFDFKARPNSEICSTFVNHIVTEATGEGFGVTPDPLQVWDSPLGDKFQI